MAVLRQLRDVLAKEGLERIDPLGEEFDPTAHEAVGPRSRRQTADARSATDPAPASRWWPRSCGPGYRWKGAVVRPAMVPVRG